MTLCLLLPSAIKTMSHMALFVHESLRLSGGHTNYSLQGMVSTREDIHPPKILAKNRDKMGEGGVILGCPYSFACPCPIS